MESVKVHCKVAILSELLSLNKSPANPLVSVKLKSPELGLDLRELNGSELFVKETLGLVLEGK